MGDTHNIDQPIAGGMPSEREPENPPPWEMIESGRYMPRRIRGSYRGRELG